VLNLLPLFSIPSFAFKQISITSGFEHLGTGFG